MKKEDYQVYHKFYTLLYSYKLELEKSRKEFPTNPEKRLKHSHLDQMQMLLECFYNKETAFYSYAEVIDNFRLMEEVFLYRIVSGGDLKKDGKAALKTVYMLSVPERIQFLKWYLKEFSKFFGDIRNMNIYQMVPVYITVRNETFGFESPKKKEDYKKKFLEYQKGILAIQKYFRNPDDVEYENAQAILKSWHISKRYRDLLLTPTISKVEPIPVSNWVSTKTTPTLTRKDQYALFQQLWNGKEVAKYLTPLELKELKELFTLFYGTSAEALCQIASMQNQALYHQERTRVRQIALSLDEEEKYQQMAALSLDRKTMNPYYYGQLRKSVQNIEDIIDIVAFMKPCQEFDDYCDMIHEEYQAMLSLYADLFVAGNVSRNKELD